MNSFQEYLIHEFVEDYRDGLLSRRALLRRVLHITGGVAATAMVLRSLGVETLAEARAAGMKVFDEGPAGQAEPRSPLHVPPDDPSIETAMVTYASGEANVRAYLARPPGDERWPAVLVCHENRGLTEHIQDVARRYAKEGYVALAPDLLSREGGTEQVGAEAAPGALSGAPAARHVGDFRAGLAWLQVQPFVGDRPVGMTGFCFGGGITWQAATEIPDLKAAVPYYGAPPPLESVPKIQAAVLGIYSDDPQDFANRGRDELAAALQAAGKTFEIKVYPNTQHAFHNDTGPRYNQEQALAAWRDTLAWFAVHLKGEEVAA